MGLADLSVLLLLVSRVRAVRFSAAIPISGFGDSLVVADLDGDGDVDLVSGSEDRDAVSWWENQPRGTFREHVVTTTAREVRSVAVADVDGDRRADVLYASWLDDAIAYGTGTQVTTTADGVTFIDAGDLDGDGDADVVAALEAGLVWFENEGAASPSFERRREIHQQNEDEGPPVSLCLADVDGDLDLDVLSAGESSLAWHENDGAYPPTFGKKHVLSSTAATSVVAGDVDGDADLDVIASSDSEVAWYENPSFVKHSISSRSGGGSSVCVGDVDLDGDLDVIVASTTIAWFENPDWTAREVAATRATVVRAADLDGDTDLDVVAASRDRGLAWFESHARSPALHFEAVRRQDHTNDTTSAPTELPTPSPTPIPNEAPTKRPSKKKKKKKSSDDMNVAVVIGVVVGVVVALLVVISAFFLFCRAHDDINSKEEGPPIHPSSHAVAVSDGVELLAAPSAPVVSPEHPETDDDKRNKDTLIVEGAAV